MSDELPETQLLQHHPDDGPNDIKSIPSDNNEVTGMAADEYERRQMSTDPTMPQVDPNDPVVDFLLRLNFSTNLFQELDETDWNAEKFRYYYQTPDLFVIRNAIGILNVYDEPGRERDALINLLKWMMLRIATDPYWFSRLGWLIRFLSSHMNPSSYWPLKYHEVYTPKYWKDDSINNKRKEEINQEIRDPDDVFNW